MNQQFLIASGIGALGLLGGSIYLNVRNNSRDKRAGLFMAKYFDLRGSGTLSGLKKTAFNTRYLEELKEKGSGPIAILQQSKAISLAKRINGAFNWYNDEEDVIYGVFDSLNSKAKVSQVASAYLTDYKVSLFEDLNSRLSKEEFQKIKNQVQTLKDY